MAANSVKNSVHWGDLVDQEDVLLSTDGTKYENNKVKWSAFEIPPLYQPSSCHKGPKKEMSKKSLLWMKPPVDSKGQSYLLQSIELQHYKRRMRYMLSAAHSHQNEMQKASGFDTPVLPSAPQPPKRFCSTEGCLVGQSQSSFLSTEYIAVASKKGLEGKHFQCPIQLDALSARQLLLKSVAAVNAHSGFEAATETALSTLTDVSTEYCLNLCKALKSRLEYKQPDETIVDSFNHILQHFSSDDLTSLQDYWLTRIKSVALKLEKEDLTLLDEYNNLKESSVRSTVKEENG